MRALVTGATGFIGSHLVKVLIDKGFDVRVLVRKTSNLRWIEGLPVERFLGELTDPASLEGISEGVDYVFHLAALLKGHRKEDYIRGNATATENLLRALADSKGIRRFVYLSSQAAAGPALHPRTEDEEARPVSYYGLGKLLAEEAVRRSGLPYTILRPPAVYGPRDRELLFYFRSLKRGHAVLPGNPEVVKVIYVEDLVEAIVNSALSDTTLRKTYFVAGEESLSAEALLREIARALGMERPRITKLPPQIVLPPVAFWSFVQRLFGKASMVNPDKIRELSQPGWNCSIEAAKKDFGFTPRHSLREGLSKTVKWYRETGWL
ncbi:MAG: NAD-dependent epimerase/dehydratase family protein [Candidatus Hydrothermae bacterium]|nr:NAD-dependent epimerase/dehydratase family protein [Candidatus Hydrothermae bacterium]